KAGGMSDSGLYTMDDQDMCHTILPDRPSSAKKKNRPKAQHAITVAVSSRTLFNMSDERAIFEAEGLECYVKYQQDHENEPLKKGHGFPLLKAMEAVNSRLHELYPGSEELFDVVLMTNNHAQVGVRLINSINHYGLTIERFCMTGGTNPVNYLKAYHTNLYLSSDPLKVAKALGEGVAAACTNHLDKDSNLSEQQLRVAFDGDSFVHHEDNVEKYGRSHGLDMSFESFSKTEEQLLAPLVGFLEALGKLQKKFFAKNERMDCPIRIYLIMAKCGATNGAKALKIIRGWGLEVDEAFVLYGTPKLLIIDKIRPHIFFDDQMFPPDQIIHHQEVPRLYEFHIGFEPHKLLTQLSQVNT
uniref:Cytosolic 5'-nucleotidase 1A-like n=1 Tax=Callorhinchus milii TaxID=7868 RepID=A0A4W3HI29_CALMI